MKTQRPHFTVDSKPRFTVDTAAISCAVTKSKYAPLTLREKLQVFVELACYCDDIGRTIIDTSHPGNREKAEEWFGEHLYFLGKRDAGELRDIWLRSIEDGSCTGTLFTAVKRLQDKYDF